MYPWNKAICAALALSFSFYSCVRLSEQAPIRLLLVGDSTVTDDAGWGGAIGEFLKPNVRVINRAVKGAASRNYFDDGYLQRALEEKPDFVFIQFGHNDCPGKGPKRETDPHSTYPEYLRRYVEVIRGKGARPVLFSSVSRRTFGADGKIKSSLAPYAEAVRQVGKDLGVPVIDLHSRSIELYERLGDAGSRDLQPEGDRTHFVVKGAEALALLIAAEMANSDRDVQALLKPVADGEAQ